MKILFILTALILSMTLSSQENNYDYYFGKSQHQKRVGQTLLVTGGVCLAGGLLIAGTGGVTLNSGGSSGGGSAGGGLLLGGVGMVLASIPFLVSGASNARKAASLSIGTQAIPVQSAGTVFTRLQPSISLKIDLATGARSRR